MALLLCLSDGIHTGRPPVIESAEPVRAQNMLHGRVVVKPGWDDFAGSPNQEATMQRTEQTARAPGGGVPAFPRSPARPAPVRLGALRLASRYLLAPLAGYTNLSFRLAVRALGGLGLATTDLVNARALLQQSRKTMDLLQTCPQDRPVAVQIYGAKADDM